LNIDVKKTVVVGCHEMKLCFCCAYYIQQCGKWYRYCRSCLLLRQLSKCCKL